MFSEAHLRSRRFIIDPAYSAEESRRRAWDSKKYYWLYGHYECEAFLLERMVQEKNEAKLKVGYTKFRRQPSASAVFRREFAENFTLEFCACGEIDVQVDGETLLLAPDDGGTVLHKIESPRGGTVTVVLRSGDLTATLPALRPERYWNQWSCSLDGGSSWENAEKIEALPDGTAPHLRRLPRQELPLKRITDELWDAGVEIFGYVKILSAKPCCFFAGESLPEAENENPADFEQNLNLVELSSGVYRSEVPLAFRYIRLQHGAGEAKVSAEALFHPVHYRGAFAVPGDDELTRCWMHSAYTLHLCMHNFLLDGIKRDRLPWAGDLAVSLLGNAFTFGDREMVRASLRVLNAAGIRDAHVNTIADYTAWWLICHELYQLYFDDPEFLQSEYPRIVETVETLYQLSGADGTLQQREKDWFFIDWVPGEKFTAVQILYVRALRAVAALAKRRGDHETAGGAALHAAALSRTIRKKMYDADRGLFTAAPGSKELSRHANLLAAATGFVSHDEAHRIADALSANEMAPVGTPYMSVLEALALHKGGRSDAALELVRRIWGGMLKLGATTFWEGFDPAEKDLQHYVFYERPFGKSLCHAWSCGPLFLLPRLLLDIYPAEDGWKSFHLDPMPGCSLEMVIPVPGGNIEVSVVNGMLIKCIVPPGCRREA